MFFSDEKIFHLRETPGGTQNNRLWVQEDCVKADVPGNLLILNVETNAPGIMVGFVKISPSPQNREDSENSPFTKTEGSRKLQKPLSQPSHQK